MRRTVAGVVTGLLVATIAGCSPKVQVEAPSEPITINLNVKIEHEIRVKVDQDLDHVFAEQDDIF